MAKKTKFYFNQETLNYEPIIGSFSKKTGRFFMHLFSSFIFGALFFVFFINTFESPREKQLILEKSRMQTQYTIVEKQLSEMQVIMTDLQERDDNLYRVILQSEPIPLSVRTATSTNTAFFGQLFKMTTSEIVISTTKKLNSLRKQIYVQSKSYDDIFELSKNKEAMLECVPAIQPVLNKDLKRMASGYGWRIDPIYRTRRFHYGMDFTAPRGTDIYATGNGTIKFASWKQGFGNSVTIDHGFGYETVYGHMHKIKVIKGQKVKRGDIIGLVGSTGKSTGPHLHYEVHFKGKIMNPKNYYFLDLSPEEYDRMVQMSNNSGMMMD